MEHSNIQAAVEAVLFASGEPVESEKLCEAVGIVKDQLEEALGSWQINTARLKAELRF